MANPANEKRIIDDFVRYQESVRARLRQMEEEYELVRKRKLAELNGARAAANNGRDAPIKIYGGDAARLGQKFKSLL